MSNDVWKEDKFQTKYDKKKQYNDKEVGGVGGRQPCAESGYTPLEELSQRDPD